jgi:type VI secretion system protein VasD
MFAVYKNKIGVLKLNITVILLMLLLNSCGTGDMVKDVFTTITKADITIIASANLNPDIDSRPSPITIRIYELKSSSAFNNADFFALYDRDVSELGADYVARDDVEISPGETKQIARELSLDTRYLGIIAAYRDINNSVWRRVIEIEPDSNSMIAIKLNNNNMTMTVE